MSIYQNKQNASSNNISSSTSDGREVHSSSAYATSCQATATAAHKYSDNLISVNQFKNLNEDSTCIRTLLTIVARGNAIITELLRLIELVPKPYKHNDDNYISNNDRNYLLSFGTQGYLDKGKKFTLDDIIYDFSYFENPERYETLIETNDVLKKADEDLCDNFIDILTRFYLTFESIHRYASDLNNFIHELEAEVYVGQTFDRLLNEIESRQLLCEAYFLLGYMLLTVDNNFEGGLRERLIVSYYRYSSYKSSPDSSLDDTCNLLRSTGFRISQQNIYRTTNRIVYYRPESYPESFFSRVGVNQTIVDLLISKLQSVDIYNQTTIAFPHPDHRSTALGQQASTLFVILFFCPNILVSQRSRMREITDKFFYDNWIISIHMGELVNLVEAWEPYKAAKESLIQLFDYETITSILNQYNIKFHQISDNLKEYLREGWLNENSILEDHTRILNHIREANVILKWVLLHSYFCPLWKNKLSKNLHSVVSKGLPPDNVLLYNFLQNLAELEKKFLKIYSNMIKNREERMNEKKTKASETLNELIEIYTDVKPMRWIQPGVNKKLVNLLTKFTINLESLKIDQENARDLTINLINELEVAQESYSDGKNLQVVQLFMDTRDSLLYILRSLSLSNDIRVILHCISDFSYSWRIMDETFTASMQLIIKGDPLKVHSIESIFLKLASAFDTNLIRIQQVRSQEDLISVSQYYSSKLVSYIRDVLQIIPETILELLSSIINIQAEYIMKNMPSKVSLENLREYALPERRYQILELTFKVSHFAESMQLMQDTTIGLIRINSKQLLEDGIRRELVQRMSDSIQGILQFDDKASYNMNSTTLLSCNQLAQNLLNKLKSLDVVMKGYKRLFEYIQDYLFIYGLRMWQEELTRIIKFNIDQATETLLSKGYPQQSYEQSALNFQSLYQSNKAPIPIYSSNPFLSSFILRILNEILKITDPKLTIYDEQTCAWYEQKSHEKILDLRIFELITSSLSVTGLNGLDQMCSTLLVLELQKLDAYLISIVTDDNNTNFQTTTQTQGLIDSMNSIRNFSQQYTTNRLDSDKQTTSKIFATALAKIAPYSDKIINHLLCIGQLQAIRTCISFVLTTKCRYEARNLYSCLETLNTTLLSTLRHGKSFSQQKKSNTFNQQQTSQISLEEADNIIYFDESDVANIYDNIEDSQLMFELTNHLEWIGLSDPMRKIYTLSFQASTTSQVYGYRENIVSIDMIFLVLLEQCSKFYFSRSLNGFIPKQSRSFYETTYNVDGQPFFYGLITLINHYQAYLSVEETITTTNFSNVDSTTMTSGPRYNPVDLESSNNLLTKLPLKKLIKRMSFYVKCMLDLNQIPSSPTSGNCNVVSCLKLQDMSLEVANMILSIIEVIRLSRHPAKDLLENSFLPKYLIDTFQYTVCHINKNNPINSNDTNN